VPDFVDELPKAELHLHIEGTLEPEMMFDLAARNGVTIPYSSPDAVREAYRFESLQEFLDIYYAGADVLRTEQDFYDLTYAYMSRASRDQVRHAEIFFDPQTHTDRGIAFETVVTGISSALRDAGRDFSMTSGLILCFLRHLSAEAADATLTAALPWRDHIIGVGLDSSEAGHPPSKFVDVFRRARHEGFKAVAHAGEEGPASNIADSIELLGVSRIDHGVRCMDDDNVLAQLVQLQMPLTVCPLSNICLKVFPSMQAHNIKQLYQLGVCVTVNSDDPAYFGGYVNDNYRAIASALDLKARDLAGLAINSFDAAFISDADKSRYRDEITSLLL